ncbi:uncharacterized protein [Primulina huaijiensis]|uniref:uncharacterized protein n=1 Tax=Primulina huaijiensis TaxID=1492673 RepID=UPI003CC703F5
MEFIFNKTIFLFVLILVIDGSFFGKPVDATALEDVCRKTFDENYCLTDFGSSSSTKTAPIPALANLAIGKVIENMNMTQRLIDLMLYLITDPQIHNVVTECKNFYVPAFSSILSSAYDNLNHGQYRQLGQQATQVFNAADQCEKAYATLLQKPPFEDSIYNLKRLSNILEVIADDFL